MNAIEAGWREWEAHDEVLVKQQEYYRSRAQEYDLTAYGPDLRAAQERADRVLSGAPIVGSVLEIACGTGFWTTILARRANRVLAIDTAPTALALARQRCRDQPQVRFAEADAFALRPGQLFDTVFMAFWLSHVPSRRQEVFLRQVTQLLRPEGSLVVIDQVPTLGVNEVRPDLDSQPEVAQRSLRDGSVFRIIKRDGDQAVVSDDLARSGFAHTTVDRFGEWMRIVSRV